MVPSPGSQEASLFRSEALDASRASHLGAIRLGGRPSFALATIAAIVLGVAIIAYSICGHVTRSARVSGVLMPALGTLQVSSSATGVLLGVKASEGEVVQAGQPLFVLGVDHKTASGDIAGLVAQSIETRRAMLMSERSSRTLQAQQRLQALDDRRKSLQAELRQADAEVEFDSRRVALATKTLQRYQDLAKESFVAEIQVQQKQEELIDLQSRAQSTGRNRTALQRDAQSNYADQLATASQLRTDLAQLDRSLASLDQEHAENDARRQIVIAAPQAGMVSAITLKTGQAVQSGQNLASIVPSNAGHPSELEAQLYAPSRTAGLVQPGQHVWMRYAAFPFQKFGMHGGEVIDVSRTPLSPQDLPEGQGKALLQAAQSDEPLYRITVKLDAQTLRTHARLQALKPGMTLDADVVQEERAVWEWLLEPVIAASVKARVVGGGSSK